MTVWWEGKGYWVIFLVALAMLAPMIILQQVDGPAIDYGVATAMTIAAVIILILGFWLNRQTLKGHRSAHAFFFIPVQYWAVPMLIFAALLGTRTITTEESPPDAFTRSVVMATERN